MHIEKAWSSKPPLKQNNAQYILILGFPTAGNQGSLRFGNCRMASKNRPLSAVEDMAPSRESVQHARPDGDIEIACARDMRTGAAILLSYQVSRNARMI
ncbi:MAG: hypothetical protein ACYC10_15205 [Allorhizobium sp.]